MNEELVKLLLELLAKECPQSSRCETTLDCGSSSVMNHSLVALNERAANVAATALENHQKYNENHWAIVQANTATMLSQKPKV